MPFDRYYVKNALTPEQHVTLLDEEFHHLAHVMRAKVGKEVELVNGQGFLATALVDRIDKHHAELVIRSVARSEIKTTSVILAQALPLFNRLEFIIEKATELGIQQFWLFPSMLSEKEELSLNQQKRLEHLLIGAMKQSGRLYLPSLLHLPLLEKWTEKPLGTLFFGDTRENAPLAWSAFSGKQKMKSPLLLFIGPEKGWHSKEVEMLENTFGAEGVKLSDQILRVDTAAIIAANLAEHFLLTLDLLHH
ncbi:MAG: RsmE family RNA methyltransferase [Anaerolineae bacterium]